MRTELTIFSFRRGGTAGLLIEFGPTTATLIYHVQQS